MWFFSHDPFLPHPTWKHKPIWIARVSYAVWSDVPGKSCNHRFPGRMAQCNLVSSLVGELQKTAGWERANSTRPSEGLLRSQQQRHVVSLISHGAWGGHTGRNPRKPLTISFGPERVLEWRLHSNRKQQVFQGPVYSSVIHKWKNWTFKAQSSIWHISYFIAVESKDLKKKCQA